MRSGMVFYIEKVKFTVSVIQHRNSDAERERRGRLLAGLLEDSPDSESLFYLRPL